MLFYAGKVIVFTLIALCAMNFIGKGVLQIMEISLGAGDGHQTETMEVPPAKSGAIEFDPFTGMHNSI